MKPLNIQSFVQSFLSLEKSIYERFSNYHGIDVKEHEANVLVSLVSALNSIGKIGVFDNFFIGYKIPQIGKEFDLLRIGGNYAINIEMKTASSVDKVLKQLQRNYYYLSSIGKPVYCFSFVSDTNSVYYLGEGHQLIPIQLADLHTVLEKQECIHSNSIDCFFDPSRYLVSPFNSTQKFVLNEYFLTHQQEDIKACLMKASLDVSRPRYFSITGSAGTGKTLLVYDFVKEIIKSGKKAIVIHCGKLNDGHHLLNIKYRWNISAAKNFLSLDLVKYQVFVIDEAQRIYPEQLEKLLNTVDSINGMCVLSYDKAQTLASWEERRNIDNYIRNIKNISQYNLTDKIRTNKDLSNFIRALFDKKFSSKKICSDSVLLNYFDNVDSAKSYIHYLKGQLWTVLRFTPSRFTSAHHDLYSDYTTQNSHEVIGQEFDNVAVIIDSLFTYDSNGELVYAGGSYYHPVKMLFQNITRTRKKLNVIIINNPNILERCISILE